MTGQVRDEPSRSRYALIVEGRTAFVDYRREGGKLFLTHTEVPPELGGRGVGSALARGVLDAAKAEGVRVVPLCRFIAAFIERHPEYHDLLAPTAE